MDERYEDAVSVSRRIAVHEPKKRRVMITYTWLNQYGKSGIRSVYRDLKTGQKLTSDWLDSICNTMNDTSRHCIHIVSYQILEDHLE